MIKRKDTSKLKHYQARTILGFQVIDNPDTHEEEPVIAFVGDKGSRYDSREIVLPITLEAWDRAANGVGTAPEDLANGLDRCSRYRFIILTDNLPTGVVKETNNETGEVVEVQQTREVVVGIHCFPDNNYIQADFSAALERQIPETAVIMHAYDSGEIDIIAFPGALGADVTQFLSAVERMTKIDNRAKVVTPEATYALSSAFGSEVTLRARKKKKKSE